MKPRKSIRGAFPVSRLHLPSGLSGKKALLGAAGALAIPVTVVFGSGRVDLPQLPWPPSGAAHQEWAPDLRDWSPGSISPLCAPFEAAARAQPPVDLRAERAHVVALAEQVREGASGGEAFPLEAVCAELLQLDPWIDAKARELEDVREQLRVGSGDAEALQQRRLDLEAELKSARTTLAMAGVVEELNPSVTVRDGAKETWALDLALSAVGTADTPEELEAALVQLSREWFSFRVERQDSRASVEAAGFRASELGLDPEPGADWLKSAANDRLTVRTEAEQRFRRLAEPYFMAGGSYDVEGALAGGIHTLLTQADPEYAAASKRLDEIRSFVELYPQLAALNEQAPAVLDAARTALESQVAWEGRRRTGYEVGARVDALSSANQGVWEAERTVDEFNETLRLMYPAGNGLGDSLPVESTSAVRVFWHGTESLSQDERLELWNDNLGALPGIEGGMAERSALAEDAYPDLREEYAELEGQVGARLGAEQERVAALAAAARS